MMPSDMYVTTLFLWTKDQAQSWIREHINMIKKKYMQLPKYLWFNNGKELVNKGLKKWAAENGIIVETTAPYSQSQNRVAERFNQTLLKLACAMLFEKNLPIFLWDKAVAHAAYLYNQVPIWALDGMTLFEAWTGEKLSIGHLCEFRCDIWVLDESKNRSKLSPRLDKMKFTGFMDGSKSICYYDAATWLIKVSWHFAFNENDGDSTNPTIAHTTPNTETPSLPPVNTATTPAVRPVWEGRKDLNYRKVNNPHAQPFWHIMSQAEPTKTRESAYLTSQTLLKTLSEHDLNNPEWLPQTVKEALKSDEKNKWRKAIDDELEQLWEKSTWQLEELPKEREAVGCKWVFLRKKDEDGNIKAYKAWLVA